MPDNLSSVSELAERKVVVTGGAGLIGSSLVQRLVDVGAFIVVADDFSKGSRNNLAGISDQIEIREGDLEELPKMESALDGAEFVFHLASRAYGIAYSDANHLQILEHNERVTNNLIAVLARRQIKYLQVASSSCVYPDDGPDTVTELPTFTREPEFANWGYGWAKRFLEQKVALLARLTGTPVGIVRPFNIYGERYQWLAEASQAIPMLVKKVLDGNDPVVVWGSGTQRRNYMHADDCANAMLHLAAVGFTGIVNIGAEDTVTMFDLVEKISRISGREPRVIADATKPEGRRVKSADATKLRIAAPKFRAAVDLDEGLRRMLGWYRASFGGEAE
jgi:nucleoside-diphosphate-sugar epimerase